MADSVEVGHSRAPELATNLEAGKLFFLFGALNEMPRESYTECSQVLRRFIGQCSPKRVRFLVTCRILVYGEELSGLQPVEVLLLNGEQIRAVLCNTVEEPLDGVDITKES